MTDFFMTRMGRQFYESTMPELVKQLADLNANLRKQNEPEIKVLSALLCSDHGGCGFKEYCTKCAMYRSGSEPHRVSGPSSVDEIKGAVPMDPIQSEMCPGLARGVHIWRDDKCISCGGHRTSEKSANPWGSETRRKLGIARSMLEEAKEAAEDRGGDQHIVDRINEVLLETADPWPEPHRVSRPSTDAEIAVSTNRVIRDAHNSGESTAMTMLRNLLARIHRDGGHHTEKVGLSKSVYDADIRVAYLNGQIDEPGTVTRDTMYKADLKALAMGSQETCHTDVGTVVRDIIGNLRTLVSDQAKELEALKAGPPWLNDAAHALGDTQPNGMPLALTWVQVLSRIRQIRAERDANMLAVSDLNRKLKREAVNSLNVAKLDYLNTKLGIDMNDSFEHFREQLDNALKES